MMTHAFEQNSLGDADMVSGNGLFQQQYDFHTQGTVFGYRALLEEAVEIFRYILDMK